jgi:competence protein ComEC
MAGSPPPSSFESLSRKLHEPLIPPLLAVISGILFVRFLGLDSNVALLCATASALLWLLARYRSLPRASFLAGNFAMLWVASYSAALSEEKPKPFLEAEPRELLSISGCIDSLPQREAERFFFTFAAAPGARIRVSLYLKPEEPSPAWSYGYHLQLPLRLRAIHNAGNPGNFDAERYFAHRDIYWSGSIAKGFPVVQIPNACGNKFQAAIYQTRAWLLGRIEYLAQGDKYLNAMLGALLLGDNAKLEDSWTENYRRTGTYHAIVISGIHITVLAGSVFWLLRFLPFRPMQAYVLSAILAVAYALVCDLSAPVVRAVGGYLLFLAAKHFYRKGRILNLLAAVAIVYLLFDAPQLFEASFQLSFLAVLTLASLGLPLLENTTGLWFYALFMTDKPKLFHTDPRILNRRVELNLAVGTLARVFGIPFDRMLSYARHAIGVIIWAVDLFLTSAVVLVGLCLPTILFFHRLSFSSLTANLPVVVLLSAAVPIGFAAILIGPILTPVLHWLLIASRSVVDWHLTWDTNNRLPDPPGWILLALPLLLILTAIAARQMPRLVRGLAVMVGGLFLYLVLLPFTGQPRLHEKQLEITAIDVGQGDSLFLATPEGHLALLDAGGNRSTKFDTGESTVSPYLWSRQIARLDTLIASHGDIDHMGGLIAAHENFQPKEIWVSSQVSGALWERLKSKAMAKGTRIRYLSKGDRLHLGELEVSTLWPPGDEPIDKSNLTSLVLLLRYGNKTFLLTGDIDQSVEARLLEDPALPKLDFLKIAHHGSKTSSSDSFLAQTRPAIAVASAGFQNSFHHPHPNVVARLEQAHTMLLRTDKMGQITILSDGRKLTADPYLYRKPQALGWIPFSQALE